MVSNNFVTIKIEIDNLIAHLKLNRPDKLNAINSVMLQELSKALDSIEKNKEVKCLIISGEGKQAFSAGADLKDLEKLSPKLARELSINGKQVFLKIENLSKPVLALINGYALGGGLELAMACSFRVASVNSQFGFPETRLGLIPGWGGTVRLPLVVGETKSKQLITSGDYTNANEALKIGLVDYVFSLDDLERKTKAIAQRLCDCPQSKGNPLKKRFLSNLFEEKFDKETEVFAYRFSLDETKSRLAEVLSQRNKK